MEILTCLYGKIYIDTESGQFFMEADNFRLTQYINTLKNT
jgi:hypothetical protein